jgi:hypothetical protein
MTARIPHGVLMAQEKEREKEPDHKVILGNIQASIWANTAKDGRIWFNVEITRSYRVGTDKRYATTFGRDDLLVVAKVADMAFDWIWEKNNFAQFSEEQE